MTINEKIFTLYTDLLKRKVTVTLLMPDGYDAAEPPNLLLLNDGQEAGNLRLKETMERLYDKDCIKPIIVAAIYAGDDRLQEYGTAARPDYKMRGSKAAAYSNFITTELLPAVKKESGIEQFNTTVFAGFSLGGLSAFDIAWGKPQFFDKVGVFSGSFWWRSREFGKGYTNADRIMHSIVRDTKVKPELKFWLQTGTNDETADRNKNGIIDSIDDTIDLIKELESKGYTRPADIQYLEVVGGTHDTTTWAAAIPKFLIWAFGR